LSCASKCAYFYKKIAFLATTIYNSFGDKMIIFKSENYIVCQKIVGVSSQKTDEGKDMPTLIHTETGLETDSIYPIHRLDNAVGGTILYATNRLSASKLSTLVAEGKITKEYLAVIHGKPNENSAVLEDLLFKDSAKNKSYVVHRMRKGVKNASLEYKVLSTVTHNGNEVSLVHIKLHTGRTHQIRVQFSSRKMPLIGDRRYGSGKDNCGVALWSHKLEFVSPFDNTPQRHTSYPDTNTFPWNLFDETLTDI